MIVGSSVAGIVTALSTFVVAAGGFLLAYTKFLPVLRANQKAQEDNSRKQDEYQAVNTAALGVLHTLGNSTLSLALQGQLEATERELVMMREIARMRAADGVPVDSDWTATTGAVQRRVNELRLALADRAEQAKTVDMQVETERVRVAREEVR